jgi:nitroreductase
MITLPKFQLLDFFEGGRAMERFWLAATNLGLAVHPLISPFYLFPRITHGNGEGLDEESVKELTALRKEFTSLTNLEESQAEVFLTKIAIAEEPTIKTYRLPLEDVLTIN